MMNSAIREKLPPDTRAWVITDGKIGDEVQCFGILEALGLTPERRVIAPRGIFTWAMPWGPIDPRERPTRRNSPLAAGTPPDIVVAAGRRGVPYLRHLKRAAPQVTFTLFVKDPYCRDHGADLIWVPQHDFLRGPGVIVTQTPANRLSAEKLAAGRRHPDSRIANLSQPRVAILLGGDSKHHHFGAREERDLANIARGLLRDGASVMVTPSRRTPPSLVAAIGAAIADSGATGKRAFVWAGDGENPYIAMLANADSVIATGDSVNMVGESLATGAPVQIYEPSGGHKKITAYIDSLVESGAVRRWAGQLESWTRAPINATPVIAAEVARRYLAFREGRR